MDYFQYCQKIHQGKNPLSFKPYYKWITFNIDKPESVQFDECGFKPYYKWITFNMETNLTQSINDDFVLNLIINGLLSIC